MAAPPSVIRYHLQESVLTIRVEGRGTMTQSLPLRRFTERAIDQGATQVRLELVECTYVDSTFLGTILTLKKALDRAGGQLLLLAPSQACGRILYQMGLEDVLSTSEEGADPNTPWSELPCSLDDSPQFRGNVVQAHQELANLPGPAGEQFKSAMRRLSDTDKPRPQE